jgi:O-antigen/teichoic acid export membrane protein
MGAMKLSWIDYLPAFIRAKLEGRHALQNVIGNTGWLFADNILRMAIGLLVSVWVTRYLGPERYGQLSYAIAFVTLFSSIALLGLDGIVIRNLIRTPERSNEILGTAFLLKLAGGTISTVLVLVSVTVLRADDPATRLLVAITALGLIFQAAGTFDYWFQSQLQSKYAALARSSSFLIIAAVKIVLITSHASLVAFAWAGTADIILGAFGLTAAYRTTGHRLDAWRVRLPMARELLKDSWPLILTDLVIMIYMRIDKIIIGELSGNTELGIYSVAALIAEALYFIPLSIASSCFPGIVQAREESETLFHEKLQRFYQLMAFAGYAVAIPMTFIAGWLVPLLFGATYARAGTMLIGLAWTSLFINLSFARSHYLTTMNWTRLHFITDLLGCIANIALNLVLVPRYGGMGAVIASAVSYWLAVHGSCFLFRPLIPTGVMLTRALCQPKPW